MPEEVKMNQDHRGGKKRRDSTKNKSPNGCDSAEGKNFGYGRGLANAGEVKVGWGGVKKQWGNQVDNDDSAGGKKVNGSGGGRFWESSASQRGQMTSEKNKQRKRTEK